MKNKTINLKKIAESIKTVKNNTVIGGRPGLTNPYGDLNQQGGDYWEGISSNDYFSSDNNNSEPTECYGMWYYFNVYSA